MAWTAPKIQALLLKMPRLQPSGHEGALSNHAVYSSPRLGADANRSGVQKSGRN